MSKVNFDMAELQVLAIYECVTRKETVEYIQDALVFMDDEDAELIEIMKRAANKLTRITDQEYEAMDLQSYLHEDADYEA